MAATNSPIIHVNIGQVKAGRAPNLLKATLGSCVGIGFLWPEKRLCGLAHCLLPDAPKASFELSAKYVSQAVPSLLRLLRIREGDLREIQVILAGGSLMNKEAKSAATSAIGDLNAAAAKKYIADGGLTVAYAEFGGLRGRHFTIDCSNFTYDISFIDKPGTEL